MAEELDLEGKVLDARVRQKKDTLAKWMANELILLDGEQAFVVDAGGQPINFKIGDGTKKFADLPYWIAYDQGQYVAVTGTVLPTPTATVGYSIVPEGTYTRAGQANVVVPTGELGVLNFGSDTWSLGSSVALPTQDISGKADTVNDEGQVVRAPEVTEDIYISIAGTDYGNGSGFYSKNTGAVVASTGRKRILFPIESNSTNLVISGSIGGASLVALAVYFDSSMTYLGFEEAVESGEETFTRFALNPPSNARFIGTGTFNAREQIKLEKHLTSGKYKEAVFKGDEYLKTEIANETVTKADTITDEGQVVRAPEVSSVSYQNVVGTSYGNDSGYYRYDTGAVVASAGRKRILFPIADNKRFAITTTMTGAANLSLGVFFDENMAYLGYYQRVQSGTVSVVRQEVTGIPANAKFFGAANGNSQGAIVLEEILDVPVFKSVAFKEDVYTKEQLKPLLHSIIFRCHGDSTTYGADLIDPLISRWTTLLQAAYPNFIFQNFGASGARAEEITVVAGGMTCDITIATGIISATAATTLTFVDINPLRVGGVTQIDAALILPNGNMVKGVLNSNSTFTASGLQANINVGTNVLRVASLTGSVSQKNIVVIGMGANNYSFLNAGTQTLAQLKQWHVNAVSQAENFMLWGWNVRSVAELTYIIPLEDYLIEKYGNKFCPLRRYLISAKARADAQYIEPTYVPTSDDIADAQSGVIPRSFKVGLGSAHLNELGHNLQANFFKTWIDLYYTF
jgi:hypothetical protein